MGVINQLIADGHLALASHLEAPKKVAELDDGIAAVESVERGAGYQDVPRNWGNGAVSMAENSYIILGNNG